MISLLDMLKEADLRTGFTEAFTSSGDRETLDRATLRRRLLLCLYGMGTNTGLRRVAAGQEDVSYKELLHVRRRFLASRRPARSDRRGGQRDVGTPAIRRSGAKAPRLAPPTARSSAPGTRT